MIRTKKTRIQPYYSPILFQWDSQFFLSPQTRARTQMTKRATCVWKVWQTFYFNFKQHTTCNPSKYFLSSQMHFSILLCLASMGGFFMDASAPSLRPSWCPPHLLHLTIPIEPWKKEHIHMEKDSGEQGSCSSMIFFSVRSCKIPRPVWAATSSWWLNGKSCSFYIHQQSGWCWQVLWG